MLGALKRLDPLAAAAPLQLKLLILDAIFELFQPGLKPLFAELDLLAHELFNFLRDGGLLGGILFGSAEIFG